jgi:hypothetical protein
MGGGRTLRFSRAAAEAIVETGCDPLEDVEAIRSGAHTETSLLAYCLDGADEDRVEAWREYVATIVAYDETSPEVQS